VSYSTSSQNVSLSGEVEEVVTESGTFDSAGHKISVSVTITISGDGPNPPSVGLGGALEVAVTGLLGVTKAGAEECVESPERCIVLVVAK